MRDLPAPGAARLPRARWLDARLLLGLFLVLVSVVIGAHVVAEADDRVQVWSVTRDLGADSPLAEGDLRPVAVRLDELTGRYVAAGEDLDGLVLTRPVGKGELLPVAAVARPDQGQQRRVVIEVDRVGVSGLAKGEVVDLYAVADPDRTTPDGTTPDGTTGDDAALGPSPDLVLAGVTVAEDVRSPGGGFGGGGSTVGVHLLVDRDRVPDVLAAVAGGTVYVVRVPS